MSEKYFFNKFTSAFTDILNQIQTEQFPAELDSNKKVISADWSCKKFLNFFVALYFRYIRLLKNVEDSYDQIINPQVRKYIKKFLANLLCRLVQVKKEIIFYNNPIISLPGIIYVFLDDYLIDMKMEPRDLDLPIPQYFREDDSDLVKQRHAIISNHMIEAFGDDLPEEDIYTKHYIVDLSFNEAINILQNFEMARQGLKRVDKIIKEEAKKATDHDIGAKSIIGEVESKNLIMENIIAHYKLKKNRYDEMELLRMIPQDTSANDSSTDNNKFAAEVRAERKLIQNDEKIEYEEVFKNNLKDKFKKIEQDDVRESMKNERRDWITKYIQEHQGEPPVDIKGFYARNDVEKKEVLDDAQIKEQQNLAKDALKKKQDTKKKEEGGQMIKRKS